MISTAQNENGPHECRKRPMLSTAPVRLFRITNTTPRTLSSASKWPSECHRKTCVLYIVQCPCPYCTRQGVKLPFVEQLCVIGISSPCRQQHAFHGQQICSTNVHNLNSVVIIQSCELEIFSTFQNTFLYDARLDSGPHQVSSILVISAFMLWPCHAKPKFHYVDFATKSPDFVADFLMCVVTD